MVDLDLPEQAFLRPQGCGCLRGMCSTDGGDGGSPWTAVHPQHHKNKMKVRRAVFCEHSLFHSWIAVSEYLKTEESKQW